MIKVSFPKHHTVNKHTNRGFGAETPCILDLRQSSSGHVAKGEKYLHIPGISLLTELSTVSFNNSNKNKSNNNNNKTATPSVVVERVSTPGISN
jgi:hypothetical protein